MQRFAEISERDEDELVNDRLPGMPLLGLLSGTVLSLGIWAAVAVIAWTV